MTLPDVQQQVSRLRPEMRGAMREMLQRFRNEHAVNLNQAMLLAALELQDCLALARIRLSTDGTGRFLLQVDEPVEPAPPATDNDHRCTVLQFPKIS